LLAFVGLEARASERSAALTLAEQKRLELARALGTAPEVLLLDEVIAGVNPSEALALASLIRSVRDERRVSILLIEHVMPAVMKLSDRVLVLDHGRGIALGAPALVVRDPRVIEAYLGSDAAAESGADPNLPSGGEASTA
jgi:branched-chain amino acid transport system ATP-binding protein